MVHNISEPFVVRFVHQPTFKLMMDMARMQIMADENIKKTE